MLRPTTEEVFASLIKFDGQVFTQVFGATTDSFVGPRSFQLGPKTSNCFASPGRAPRRVWLAWRVLRGRLAHPSDGAGYRVGSCGKRWLAEGGRDWLSLFPAPARCSEERKEGFFTIAASLYLHPGWASGATCAAASDFSSE